MFAARSSAWLGVTRNAVALRGARLVDGRLGVNPFVGARGAAPRTRSHGIIAAVEGQADGWIGRELDGRYRILELLGEGGMGSVYIAEHRTLRKQVAVKTIRPEFAANRQAEARFAREALATGKLDHPHVVSAIDYGHMPDGGAYLVTQLVRGESLARRLIRGEALRIPEVCQLGAQVADALVAAHGAGIVHRDLKPDNILLERRDDGAMHAKVVDFGVARMTETEAGGEAALPITRMGMVIGTPGYMAPEQATGGEIDARVDLYALGVILWECCAGQPLWDTTSVSQLVIAQLTRPPPNLYPDLAPSELATLVGQLLERAPDQRPASAQVVRDALRKLAREVRAEPAAPPASAHTVASPTGPNHDGAPTAADRPQTRSPRALWILMAGVSVLVAIFVATRGADAPSKTAAGAAKTSAVGTPAVIERKPATKRELPARRELLADLPEDYVEIGRVLLLSTERKERAAAGEAMAAAEGDDRAKIPAYFLQVAAFEMADDCEERKGVLREIAAADDVRVVWVLRVWKELPRSECRGRDCLGCLRGELERVLVDLEGTIVE